MQATAQDLHTARLVGIPVNRTIAVAFALGTVLSGIAGLLVAPIFLAEPTMGGSLGLKGFVVSVIGGFGNLPGAVIGGLFLGLDRDVRRALHLVEFSRRLRLHRHDHRSHRLAARPVR